jgi:hypothetical protein
MEFIDNINAYLLTKMTLYAAVSEDFFAGDSNEELMCRHDPSPKITKMYLTGSYWAQFCFSYYAKSMNVKTARQQLDSVVDNLSLPSFAERMGFKKCRVEVTASPIPVGKDEAGVVIYTSSFKLVYFQEV